MLQHPIRVAFPVTSHRATTFLSIFSSTFAPYVATIQYAHRVLRRCLFAATLQIRLTGSGEIPTVAGKAHGRQKSGSPVKFAAREVQQE